MLIVEINYVVKEIRDLTKSESEEENIFGHEYRKRGVKIHSSPHPSIAAVAQANLKCRNLSP